MHTQFSTMDSEQRKGVQAMSCRMVYTVGHVEVYDLQGNFLFSADTESEAIREMEDWAA